MTSLKLVRLRRAELESCAVPTEKIYVLGNRWEPHRTKREDVVRTAEAPMFAALPNDYEQVMDAALESRLVSRNSPFGNACAELARRLAKVPERNHRGRLPVYGDASSRRNTARPLSVLARQGAFRAVRIGDVPKPPALRQRLAMRRVLQVPCRFRD